MLIENLGGAFSEVFSLGNLALMFLGVSAGLIAGSIPGFTITMSAPSAISSSTSRSASSALAGSIW